jgi:hypothetical protein
LGRRLPSARRGIRQTVCSTLFIERHHVVRPHRLGSERTLATHGGTRGIKWVDSVRAHHGFFVHGHPKSLAPHPSIHRTKRGIALTLCCNPEHGELSESRLSGPVRHFRLHVDQDPALFVIYTREQLGENPKLAVLFRAGPSTPNCSCPHIWLRHSIIVHEKPVHGDLQSLSRPFQRTCGTKRTYDTRPLHERSSHQDSLAKKCGRARLDFLREKRLKFTSSLRTIASRGPLLSSLLAEFKVSHTSTRCRSTCPLCSPMSMRI